MRTQLGWTVTVPQIPELCQPDSIPLLPWISTQTGEPFPQKMPGNWSGSRAHFPVSCMG